MLVKIDEYIGFCFHRRSYLLGSPVIRYLLVVCFAFVSPRFFAVFFLFDFFFNVPEGTYEDIPYVRMICVPSIVV